MRKKLKLWKTLVFSIFLFTFACREEVDYVANQQQINRAEEFFKNTGTIDKKGNATLVSNSIRKLKAINSKTDFLSALSDKTGLPVWSYMVDTDLHSGHNHGTANKGNEDTTETLIIPLRQEDNFLSSVMYVENSDSDNPNIYTVTNEQLEEFANNENIDKSIREKVLMTFIYFDHEIFGERRYSSIPQELFEAIPLREENDYKSFSVRDIESTTVSGRMQQVCIYSWHCAGCIGPCDECRDCVSVSCYTLGAPSTGTTTGTGNTGDTGGNPGGGSGTNPNNVPWYLMNPDVDIYVYNAYVRLVFKSLTDYNIVLKKEQLDLLQNNSVITNTIKNCLVNNTLHKSQFINDMLTEYAIADPQPDLNILKNKLETFFIPLFDIYPYMDWQSFKSYFINHNVTLAQINNIFTTGYSPIYTQNIKKLSLKEFNDIIQINLSIANSPYEEEYVKETNEAFAAFGAYADIDNMTETQIEYVLNNNCCAGLFLQQWTKEKVKLIAANYKLLRKLYPSWSKGKAFWYAGRETLHLLLDIAGTVPVIGEVCDITNGAIYTIEGDALNAGLSYAGAIPIAGWGATGAKFAIKTVAGGIALAIAKNADGFYVVSRNQQLFRKVLGMVKGDVRIAHHIIPFALQTNPVIQKAMLSKNAFMINEALNGIPLSTAVHSGSHQHYTDLVLRRLNAIPSHYSPDQVYNEIIDIISDIRTVIKNNPNTHINQINF
ncbi:AHH domain-containing protein [Epilithonimonas caeni]|uniref:AHH domain-containing protein n=1 Tax=Epilithonimonas caeni TaxID=365343 RepID=UPI00042215B5|nr:AHH domain-containing protein [Epilithonimonas caeni]